MHKIIQPAGWKTPKGYSNGMLAEGKTLHIAGQIGWNSDMVFEHHDFIGQMTQCLKNICAVVEAANGKPEHIVRLTWFLKDKDFYVDHQAEVGAAYRSVMGYHFPAMSMVFIKDLVEDEALLEIEAAAVIP